MNLEELDGEPMETESLMLLGHPALHVAPDDVPLIFFYKNCANPACKQYADLDESAAELDAPATRSVARCGQCAKPFCDSCSQAHVCDAAVYTCGSCANLPVTMDEGKVEDCMMLSVADLQSKAEQDKEARVCLDWQNRLCSIQRKWTADERSFLWAKQDEPRKRWHRNLLVADPSNLAPLIRNLKLPEDTSEALNLMEFAKSCRQDQQMQLYRAAFVVVQQHVRDYAPTPSEAVIEKALELLVPCPKHELVFLLDACVRKAKCLLTVAPDSSRDHAARVAGLLMVSLCNLCREDKFSALELLMSMRAHQMSMRYENDLCRGMPKDIHFQLLLFDSYRQRLLEGNVVECTADSWGADRCFPLLTHRVLSHGTTAEKRKKAVGVTGSQILKFVCTPETEKGFDGARAHEDIDTRKDSDGDTFPAASDEKIDPCNLGSIDLGVMLKHDHAVMAERRVSNAMQLMERIIMESTGMQELLRKHALTAAEVKVTYHIVCLTPNDAMIEMIPDAVTLRDAKTQKRDRLAPEGPRSLREYFHGQSNTACSWERVLAFTSAISSVLSFVVALGDRHDENVMVNHEGRYVHVDYGWSLGETPAIQQVFLGGSAVRVDYREIWDAVGEETMKNCFFPVVFACFNALRGSAHFLHEIVSDLSAVVRGAHCASLSEFIRDDAAQYVTKRLLPGVLSDQQAEHFIEGVILQHREQRGLEAFQQLRANVGDTRQTLSASTLDLLKRPCAECNTSTAIADLLYHSTCHQCGKSFCERHFQSHRRVCERSAGTK